MWIPGLATLAFISFLVLIAHVFLIFSHTRLHFNYLTFSYYKFIHYTKLYIAIINIQILNMLRIFKCMKMRWSSLIFLYYCEVAISKLVISNFFYILLYFIPKNQCKDYFRNYQFYWLLPIAKTITIIICNLFRVFKYMLEIQEWVLALRQKMWKRCQVKYKLLLNY